jgi:hypothetical protein
MLSNFFESGGPRGTQGDLGGPRGPREDRVALLRFSELFSKIKKGQRLCELCYANNSGF